MMWTTLNGLTGERTGRENRLVFYCGLCRYKRPAEPYPLQSWSVDKALCQTCGRSLHWIAYEAESDEAILVDQHIGHYPEKDEGA